MRKEIIDKLNLIKNKIDEYSGYLPLGADELEMSRFLSGCILEFGVKPPVDYMKFLKVHNGLTVEGVFAYSTQRLPVNSDKKITFEFIEMNLISRDVEGMKGFFSFGESDQDEYVMQLSTGKYQVRDRQAFDNICEEFDTFNDLLEFMLNAIIRRL